jgi:antitoxin component YwqK of YwqJK toxin-antitoxin module
MSDKVRTILVSIVFICLLARGGLYIYNEQQRIQQNQSTENFQKYLQELRRRNLNRFKVEELEVEKIPCEEPESGSFNKEGQKHGKWRLCDDEYVEIGNFENGKKEGEWKYYNPYDELYQVYMFRKGKKKGPFKTFHINGNVSSEGTMKEGYMHGEYRSYYENGQIEEIGTYFFGMRIDEWKEFYENGQIASTSNYKSNKLEGSLKLYDTIGKLYYEEIFVKDSLVKKIDYR